MNTTWDEIIGGELRRAREWRGWTQRDVRNHVPELGRGSLSYYENGLRTTPTELLVKLCRTLDIDFYKLISDTDRLTSGKSLATPLIPVEGGTPPAAIDTRWRITGKACGEAGETKTTETTKYRSVAMLEKKWIRLGWSVEILKGRTTWWKHPLNTPSEIKNLPDGGYKGKT